MNHPAVKPAILPAHARLPINRCNLPAVILGSPTFQQHPDRLLLDGVWQLHSQLFRALDRIEEASERALHFHDYMASGFLLGHPDEAGYQPGNKKSRIKLDYLRLLRGWMFDADSKEAAVLKGWVESRFGLIPRYHRQPIEQMESAAYLDYLHQRMAGLYNTNGLEAQLDLLYSWCQYEVERRQLASSQTLYRGINRLRQHEIIEQQAPGQYLMLMNNLSSFTDDPASADVFGDSLLSCRIPAVKLLYFPGLIPGFLQGEREYLVIGGVYQVSISQMPLSR